MEVLKDFLDKTISDRACLKADVEKFVDKFVWFEKNMDLCQAT